MNGLDFTNRVAREARRPARASGLFGIRTAMDPEGAGVALAQSYWFYRVDLVTEAAAKTPLNGP